MDDAQLLGLLKAMALALVAGAAIPVGGLLARVEHIRPQWLENEIRHGILAFGGGALLAAVALVLVPHGQEHLSAGWIALWFALGGVTMMGVGMVLDRAGSPAANLAATLSDFLPESIALGASLGSGNSQAMLLVVLIATQNLPEGFNSFREMRAAGDHGPAALLLAFSGLSLLGPVAAGLGFVMLQDRPGVVGAIGLFAAGGILYVVVNDIAPQAKLARKWLPALGAVLGFLFGLVGDVFTS